MERKEIDMNKVILIGRLTRDPVKNLLGMMRWRSLILRWQWIEIMQMKMETQKPTFCQSWHGGSWLKSAPSILSIIGSGLVMKFIIHCGVLLSVTPFQPGPTNFSSDILWHDVHFTPAICSPELAML